MKKHPYTCRECGASSWTYRAPSSAPAYCSDCLPIIRRRNYVKLHEFNCKLPLVVVVNVCEVCGKEFIGKNKYKPYKGCTDPACRLAIRQRTGKQQAAEARSQRLVNTCLRCGEKFEATGKYNRRCVSCDEILREYGRFLECW